MGKSSSKKRRQRLKRKREELERLRGVSLVDNESPAPVCLEDSSLGAQNDADNTRRKTTANFDKTAFATVTLENGTSSHRDHIAPHDKTSPNNTTTSENPSLLPLSNKPNKGVSWKRVEFVFPRAQGNNESFVFNRQPSRVSGGNSSNVIGASNSNVSSLKEIGEENHLFHGRKDETIDDILFPGKRQKLDSNPCIDTKEGRSQSLSSSSDKKLGEDPLSEKRRRKLEETFEAIHREETKTAIDATNFVSLPKSTSQQLDGKNPPSSSLTSNDQIHAITNGEIHHDHSKVSMSTVKNEHSQSRIQSEVDASSTKLFEKKQKHEYYRESVHDGESLSPDSKEEPALSGRSVEEAVRDKHGLRPRANSTDCELNLPQRGLCDERMILEAHKWNHLVSKQPPRGFHNLGNTCFLNATLQCLAYLPPFCQTLIAIYESKMKNKTNGTNPKMHQGQRITSSLCNLFQKAHGSNGQPGGAIAPKNIVHALPTIGSCGSRNGYKFRPGRQEDAHEFLVHLLDAMNDGELRAAGINQHVSGWRDRLPVSRLDETTFIHRIFGGYFRSQVQCRKCNYRSNTYDPFLDLSLEVSRKSSNSVLNALSEFTRKETLDAENQWKCSGCKKYVCATKQLTVFRPPLSLCIQLKRFAFDSGFGFGMNGFKFSKFHNGLGGSKITKPIEFPANLNLPLSDGRSCPYALTGIVIHVGGSASSGHYTAYVKKPGKHGTSQWYHMDDSFVEPVSEKTVLKQKDAYLLFYCRKEVKLEFPSPPPRSMTATEASELRRIRARTRLEPTEDLCKVATSESQKRKAATLGMAEASSQKFAYVQEDTALVSTNEPKNGVQRVTTKNHPLAIPESLHQIKQSKKDPMSVTESQDEEEESSSSSSSSSVSSASSADLSSKGFHDRQPKGASNDVAESASDSSSGSESSDESSSASTDESSKQEEKTLGEKHSLASFRSPENHSEKDGGTSEGEFSSAGDSCSDDESDPAKEKHGDDTLKYFGKADHATEPCKGSNRTRVVLHSDSRGKVKVMLGPRKRKFWESKTHTLPPKGPNFLLLGNMGVSRWDDEDNSYNAENKKSSLSAKLSREEVCGDQRQKVVEKLEKQVCSRKRRMHLDRWDAHLDQGKQKKVKTSSKAAAPTTNTDPKKNIFQKMQAGVQRFNRGRAKGLVFPNKSNGNSHQHRKKKSKHKF